MIPIDQILHPEDFQAVTSAYDDAAACAVFTPVLRDQYPRFWPYFRAYLDTVFTTSGPEPRLREMHILCVIAAIGMGSVDLKIHAYLALGAGATLTELMDAALIVSEYAGVGRYSDLASAITDVLTLLRGRIDQKQPLDAPSVLMAIFQTA